MQEQIAAQAYILSKVLKQCKIRYRFILIAVSAAIRYAHFLIARREDELFRYVAAGNNRDGLALRAAGHLMENGEKKKNFTRTDRCKPTG